MKSSMKARRSASRTPFGPNGLSSSWTRALVAAGRDVRIALASQSDLAGARSRTWSSRWRGYAPRSRASRDRVLKAFCDVATAALRPDDLFGRLGGEEFASLLPHTSLDEGLAVAERIRSDFEAATLEVGAKTPAATVSVGVAMSTDPSRNCSPT